MGSNRRLMYQHSIHQFMPLLAVEENKVYREGPSLEGSTVIRPNPKGQKPDEVKQLFESLCRPIIKKISKCQNPKMYRELVHRLWHLPKQVTSYYHHCFHQGKVTNTQIIKTTPQDLEVSLRAMVAGYIGKSLLSRKFQRFIAKKLRSDVSNISFKPWTHADLTQFVSLINKSDLNGYMPDTDAAAITERTARKLIDQANTHSHRHRVRAVYYKNKIIGEIRLTFNQQDKSSAEMSYWFEPQFWRQGVASKVIGLFTFKSFMKCHDTKRIFVLARKNSSASLSILESIGYRYESAMLQEDGWTLNQPSEVLSIMKNEFDYLLSEPKEPNIT